jgi:hypothetical protein
VVKKWKRRMRDSLRAKRRDLTSPFKKSYSDFVHLVPSGDAPGVKTLTKHTEQYGKKEPLFLR